MDSFYVEKLISTIIENADEIIGGTGDSVERAKNIKKAASQIAEEMPPPAKLVGGNEIKILEGEHKGETAVCKEMYLSSGGNVMEAIVGETVYLEYPDEYE